MSDQTSLDLDRLVGLADAGTELAGTDSLDECLLTLCRIARDTVGATYASLGFVRGDVIRWEAAAGKPLDEVRGYEQPIDDGLCGWVVRHGRSRRSGDVTDEPDYFCQYAEMRSELDVPIMAGDRVIGVLSTESPEINAFAAADEALLRTLAGYAAVALSHRDAG